MQHVRALGGGTDSVTIRITTASIREPRVGDRIPLYANQQQYKGLRCLINLRVDTGRYLNIQCRREFMHPWKCAVIFCCKYPSLMYIEVWAERNSGTTHRSSGFTTHSWRARTRHTVCPVDSHLHSHVGVKLWPPVSNSHGIPSRMLLDSISFSGGV